MLQLSDSLTIRDDCPICGSKSFLVDKVKTINEKSNYIVELRECCECAHWWHSPIPSQQLLSSWYRDKSEFVVPPNYIGTSADNVDSVKIYKKLISSFGNKDINYLEVGCGNGNLLKYFSSKFSICYGVEPGKWVKDDTTKIVPDLKDLPGDIKFDIVVIQDVLEHVADPVGLLKKINSIVNPSCVISLGFPNKDSLKAKIRKGKWSMILPFGHIHYFSSKSIDIMSFKADFDVIKKQPSRCGLVNNGIIDVVRMFILSGERKIYSLIKALFLGQILLGKDQWQILISKKNKS